MISYIALFNLLIGSFHDIFSNILMIGLHVVFKTLITNKFFMNEYIIIIFFNLRTSLSYFVFN